MKRHEYTRLYRLANIDAIRARKRAYYKSHSEKWKSYYAEHRDELALKQRLYNAKNRHRILKQRRRYRLKHRMKLARYFRDYGIQNAERLREYKKTWNIKNRERLSSQKKRYYKQNRCRIIEKVSIWQRENRDRVNTKNTKWIREERLKAIRLFGARCVRCGYHEVLEILQFDHRTPIHAAKRRTFGHREALRNPDMFQLLCPNCHLKKTVSEIRKAILSTAGMQARRKRSETVEQFGGRCFKCRFSDKDCLELDHIMPRFRLGLKRIKNDLEARKYPERFQLLCANCHRIKTLIDIRETFRLNGRMVVV